MAPVAATDPYSNGVTQLGSNQGCPSDRKYQTT
jgi:hypothetical protein